MAEKSVHCNSIDVHSEKWLTYVAQFRKNYNHGQKLTTSTHIKNKHKHTLPFKYTQHKVILCSPHPDDEVLTGALALRLMAENIHILNLTITLGSNPSRQNERKAELAESCRVLGFDCRLVRNPLGFPDIINFRKRKISEE